MQITKKFYKDKLRNITVISSLFFWQTNGWSSLQDSSSKIPFSRSRIIAHAFFELNFVIFPENLCEWFPLYFLPLTQNQSSNGSRGGHALALFIQYGPSPLIVMFLFGISLKFARRLLCCKHSIWAAFQVNWTLGNFRQQVSLRAMFQPLGHITLTVNFVRLMSMMKMTVRIKT